MDELSVLQLLGQVSGSEAGQVFLEFLRGLARKRGLIFKCIAAGKNCGDVPVVVGITNGKKERVDNGK